MTASIDLRALQAPPPVEPDIGQSLADGQQPGDAAVVARVKTRVMEAVTQKSSLLHRTVRADGGVWEPVGPGLERKVLWESGDALSFLMKLAPGAVASGHSHLIDEECVVLEGTLRIGPDLLLRAGDFHVGVAGVDHQDGSTDTGALLYVRGARPRAETVG